MRFISEFFFLSWQQPYLLFDIPRPPSLCLSSSYRQGLALAANRVVHGNEGQGLLLFFFSFALLIVSLTEVFWKGLKIKIEHFGIIICHRSNLGDSLHLSLSLSLSPFLSLSLFLSASISRYCSQREWLLYKFQL